MDPVLNQTQTKIQEALHHLKIELSGIRAGRANPSLIENLDVDVYGGRMKLMELGTISAPQPSLLTVQVWDASAVQSVVKAIQESSLGLNPSFEGNLVRLAIPPLTQERREEFIRLSQKKLEETKVQIRQIRQEERQAWDKQKDAGEFGDDELHRRDKILQELIDTAMGEVDTLGKQKEEELSEI